MNERWLQHRIETPDAAALVPEHEIGPALTAIAKEQARLGELQAALMARGLALAARPAPEDDGRLLTAVEAADQMGVSKRWLYSHARKLPFTRKLARGTMRFAENGLKRCH